MSQAVDSRKQESVSNAIRKSQLRRRARWRLMDERVISRRAE